jgi:hypothetical protein
LPQVQFGHVDAKNLAGVHEHATDHELVGGQVAPILALDAVLFVLLRADGDDRLTDVGQDERNVAVFVGVEDLLLPVLLG